MLLIEAAVLLTTVLIVLLVGYYLMKTPYDDLLGVASGATGNPAILVYSTRMAPTERPDIGYAMIFSSMTIVKSLPCSHRAAVPWLRLNAALHLQCVSGGENETNVL